MVLAFGFRWLPDIEFIFIEKNEVNVFKFSSSYLFLASLLSNLLANKTVAFSNILLNENIDESKGITLFFRVRKIMIFHDFSGSAPTI